VIPAAAALASAACRRRSAPGGRWKSCWKVSLNLRTLPKPEANANLAHRQQRLLDQLLGPAGPGGSGPLPPARRQQVLAGNRRRKLPLADPQARSQGVHVAPVHRAGLDQRQRPARRCWMFRARLPGQAKTPGGQRKHGRLSRLLAGRRAGVEGHVLRLRRPRGGRSAGSRSRWCGPRRRSARRSGGSRVRKACRQAAKSISMRGRWDLGAAMSRGFRT